MLTLEGKYGKDCKVFIDHVEDSALRTIHSILDDEVSAGVPIRIMPDTHDGVDIVIGFTMPLTDRVKPNHIGVDIGCGVSCIEIPKIDQPLFVVDMLIREAVPMGFSHRETPMKIDGPILESISVAAIILSRLVAAMKMTFSSSIAVRGTSVYRYADTIPTKRSVKALNTYSGLI